MFDKIKKYIEAKRTINNWDYIFTNNPEIEKIGSRQEYIEYTKTIFPESTFKKVCFHGGRKGIVKFLSPNDPNFKKNKGVNSATKDYGIYFTADKELAKTYTKGYKKEDRQIYSVLVNIKNPLRDNGFFALHIRKKFNDNILNPQSITLKDHERLTQSGYDSIIWQGDNGEIIVFQPEQIHILGTEEDLNKFKQWKQTKTISQIITKTQTHEPR